MQKHQNLISLERERDRQTDRQTETQRERDRERQRQRETETKRELKGIHREKPRQKMKRKKNGHVKRFIHHNQKANRTYRMFSIHPKTSISPAAKRVQQQIISSTVMEQWIAVGLAAATRALIKTRDLS